MVAVPKNIVDREKLFNEIKQQIEGSPNGEVEITATDFANKYGVQSPTMDYHLKKLVDEGYLAVSPKRGKFNRKIYRLPTTNTSTNKPKTEVHKPFENQQSNAKFQEFIQKHKEKQQKAVKKPKDEVSVAEAATPYTKDEPKVILEKTKFTLNKDQKGDYKLVDEFQDIDDKQNNNIVDEAHRAATYTNSANNDVDLSDDQSKKEWLMNHFAPKESQQNNDKYDVDVTVLLNNEKELTLDERIQQFLEDANKVHDANVLLHHEDREILSVINETIQQQQIYLKDLSEQLSTLQNKELIQSLIDDRNRLMKENERLRDEADTARAQASDTKDKYHIEENRVRFMHQLIIDTVDQFVKLPNHAIALGRHDFRNKISKEVRDLVKYVLGLEK